MELDILWKLLADGKYGIGAGIFVIQWLWHLETKKELAAAQAKIAIAEEEKKELIKKHEEFLNKVINQKDLEISMLRQLEVISQKKKEE